MYGLHFTWICCEYEIAMLVFTNCHLAVRFNRLYFSKDNVMQLWEYLLELLASRRRRLLLNVRLQQMFQAMIALLDWMSDVKVGGLLNK